MSLARNRSNDERYLHSRRNCRPAIYVSDNRVHEVRRPIATRLNSSVVYAHGEEEVSSLRLISNMLPGPIRTILSSLFSAHVKQRYGRIRALAHIN